MADIIISHHTTDDLYAIAEIEKVSINPPWSYKAICDFSSYETSRIIVAKYDGIVAGYITSSAVLDEIQIANVATHPNYRRLGIGEKLMTFLSEEAKCSGRSVITLEVRNSNTPAIRLYEKCGFERVGVRKNYYKNPSEDAVLMNLTL